MNPLRDSGSQSYADYIRRVQELQSRAAADTGVDWERLKLDAEQVARTCPFFDLARICFQLIAQAAEKIQTDAEAQGSG
jgi:hypothetical protein